MFIGRYNPFYYTSFAVTPAGNTGCHNDSRMGKKWVGLQGAGGSSTGTGYGKTCADARTDFCKKYGVNGKCYGDPGAPPHDDPPKYVTQRTRTAKGSEEKVVPNPARSDYNQLLGASGRGSGISCGKICATPPNTIEGWYHYAACEFESKTCLPDWGFPVVLGIGGLIVLAIMFKGAFNVGRMV